MIKRFLCPLCFCFLFAAFAHAGGVKDEQSAPAPSTVAQPDPWAAIAEPRLLALPSTITPGQACAVIYVLPQGQMPEGQTGRAELYNEAGKKIAEAALFKYPLDEEGHVVQAAVLSPPSTCAPGKALIKIIKIEEGTAHGGADIPIVISARDFAAEIIPLNPSNTSLRTESDPKKTAESAQLWAILSATGTEIYSTGPFIPPVPAGTRRSSFFGDRRVYQYSNGKSDTSVHAGIDFAVPKGTEVHAPADGKVALACPRIVTGNSIILEHLPGLYSIYYHLEKINVKEGDIVRAGDIIGLSGSTGLSTGPHLHWEIRASTENTDPDALPTLDRGLILQHIFGQAP
jgi:murein DD-endopeptidase MepM/ murein hydrolase activator NlpD